MLEPMHSPSLTLCIAPSSSPCNCSFSSVSVAVQAAAERLAALIKGDGGSGQTLALMRALQASLA